MALLLACLTLSGLVGCGGDEIDTEQSTAVPEEETVGLPELTVTEGDGEAMVTTTQNFTYLAKNYSSVDGNAFTFNQGLEITFPEGGFEAEFNRVNFLYAADAPMKVYITYTLDGEQTEDYFFMDAFKTSFSGLITAYLDGKRGAKLEKVVFNTCEKIDATLTLYSLNTETIPLYDDDLFIENDRFKFGVRLSWGGAVTYYEDKNDGIERLENMVNIHDTGRLIQQSFYGTYSNGEYVSGTQSSGAIWPYNPVQGGDKKNNGSERLINIAVGEDYIYILSQALDWGFDENISFCYYENTYTLHDEYVKVDNVATDYSGWKHRVGGQEIPAVYLVSFFDTLCYYNGTKPWTGDTEGLKYVDNLGGWDESGSYYFGRENTEVWATWINTKNNFGFGIYCPNVDKLIAIRHQYSGTTNPWGNPTTYVAPSSSITMQAYKPIVYSYLLTSGTPDYVRGVFAENKDFTDNASLSEDKQDQRVSLDKVDMTDMDFTKEQMSGIICGKNNTEVSYNAEMQATQFRLIEGQDPYVSFDFGVNSDRVLSADDYNTVEFEYMIPTDTKSEKLTTYLFLSSGDIKKATEGYTVHTSLIKDGEYHTARLYLPDDKWSGEIHKIRFDFFYWGEAGDLLFLKSFRLTNQQEIAAVNDLTAKGSEAIFASVKETTVVFDDAEGAVKIMPTVSNGDVNVELIFSNLALSANTYKNMEIEYMIPASNSNSSYSTLFYYCAGEMKGYTGSCYAAGKLVADGEYHTLTVSFDGKEGWSGQIGKIRFDYFEGKSEPSDVIYIKSIKLK